MKERSEFESLASKMELVSDLFESLYLLSS